MNRQEIGFDLLSRPQQRVAIARDVLAQLQTGSLVAANSVYVGTLRDSVTFDLETQICDIVKQAPKCRVCGIGGLFVSAVQFANAVKVKDFQNSSFFSYEIQLDGGELKTYLLQFFEAEQLTLIERAFEKWDDTFAPNVTDPAERMRLIMENIVAHHGRFDPTHQPIPIAVAKVEWVTEGYRKLRD